MRSTYPPYLYFPHWLVLFSVLKLNIPVLQSSLNRNVLITQLETPPHTRDASHAIKQAPPTFKLTVNSASVLPALVLLVPRLCRLGTSTSRVYRVPPHRVRPVYAVEFVVEAARVAHHLPFHVPPPYRRGLCAAVRAREINPSRHSGAAFAALHDLEVAPGAVAREVWDVVLAVVSAGASRKKRGFSVYTDIQLIYITIVKAPIYGRSMHLFLIKLLIESNDENYYNKKIAS